MLIAFTNTLVKFIYAITIMLKSLMKIAAASVIKMNRKKPQKFKDRYYKPFTRQKENIEIANYIIKELRDSGIKAYIYSAGKETHSVYVDFENIKYGTLAIKDHKGIRECNKHKWYLRTDIEGHKKNKSKKFGYIYTYGYDCVEGLIDHIRKY